MDRQEEKTGRKRVRKAAALSYDVKTDPAPRLVAVGGGEIAEKIIAKAREAGVPVQEDAELIEHLCRVELGSPIPPELYEAVAAVLVFVMSLEADLA
ncbi:MAG: flagellar biosynthesis [Clostridia bacterium]|jgi:flagellar biosynthesis protein|nr:flagellar biosynthesis [Clostridia bacterium]